MWPKVNKDFLPLKGHYFLYNAGIAAVQPFMTVYAKQLSFSSVVVGTIYTVLPIIGMIAKPSFGAIADRYRLHKFLFFLFQIVTIVAFFSIQFIPKISETNNENVNIVCGSQTNFHVNISNVQNKCAVERALALSDSNETLSCSMKCNLTPDFLNEICYHWGEKLPECPGSGSATKSDNILTGTNHVGGKELKSTDVGKDVYAGKFKASALSGPKVEFKAIVPLRHTDKEGNILYFRVSAVIFKNDSQPHIPYCIQEIDTSCHMECEDSRLAELTNEQETELDDVANMYQFWLLLLFLIMSWVGMAVVGSISDAICFEMLGAKASQYGNQRLFGSIGWGVFALLTGVIIDEFSKGKADKNYTPIFYIMLIMLLLDIACMHTLKYQQTKLSNQIFRNVRNLLTNVRVVLFLLWCIIVGISIGIQWNFLFWYVEKLATDGGCDNTKWLKTLQGLLSAIQCFLGELPSYFFSGYLLKKFGHVNVMSGILFFFGIRFILYSFLTNPWWCLPIEIFQATVGLSFATMASYASIVAPSGMEATVQGLVGATFEGVGVSLGSFLGGYFFKNYGGAVCFRIFGLVSLGAFVLHSASPYVLRRSDGFNLDGKVNISLFFELNCMHWDQIRTVLAFITPITYRYLYFIKNALINEFSARKMSFMQPIFNGVAKYASPKEAVSMLEDT